MVNVDEKKRNEIHWISLFIDRNATVCFNFFVIKYTPHKILDNIKDKSVIHNIFRIQDNDSIMWIFYCTSFIEHMLPGKTLLDYTNSFSPNDYKKNDKIIYKFFKDKYVKSRI